MEAIERVRQFIEQHRLMDATKLYLVAVSGGADSVCLLLILQQLGYRVEAVHCNFNLRGEESLRDELFVKGLCNSKGIHLHITHFDTKTYADAHKVSMEMAARTLRYHYFEQLRQDIDAAGICVAHHQEDSVETILINLARGTGIRGLCGIQPVRDHIIRPLLCLSRTEIEGWLREQHQVYVTDSTNQDTVIVRNHYRHAVIPLLKEKVPAVVENILCTARHLNEIAKVYDASLKSALERLICNDSIDISLLQAEPSPECVLYEWLSPKGFSSATIESIAEKLTGMVSGNEWQSETHALTFHQGRLIVEPIQDRRPVLVVPETGTYIYDDTTRIRISTTEETTISKERFTCTLDAGQVLFPLTIRPVSTGDSFQPLGMKGRKLLSDFLCEQKLNIFERRRQLVVTQADGTIIWLVGLRPDHRFRVTEQTETVLMINCSKE